MLEFLQPLLAESLLLMQQQLMHIDLKSVPLVLCLIPLPLSALAAARASSIVLPFRMLLLLLLLFAVDLCCHLHNTTDIMSA
jgi:hypothetical protein